MTGNVELKAQSPLMKFKQFLRGRRSLPDLRQPFQVTPNLEKTSTIQGTVKHIWGSPVNAVVKKQDTSHSDSKGDTTYDSDNDSIDSAFSFNVSIRYYKEKAEDDVKSDKIIVHEDERIKELMDEYDEHGLNEEWYDGEYIDDDEEVFAEDETDNLFNRDLFGLEKMANSRARANLEL